MTAPNPSRIAPAEFKRAIVALDRELVRRDGFYKFVELAWQHVSSNSNQPFVPARHIEEMCKHAEHMTPGSRACPHPPRELFERGPVGDKAHAAACNAVMPTFQNLVCNIPPGYTKSMVWGILWLAWIWTFRPEYRQMYVSYDHGMSMLNARLCRDLVRSQWYRERWGDILHPTNARKEGEFWTKAGGLRFSTSIGGKGTGRHFHGTVVDDPIKPLRVETVNEDIGAQVKNANSWMQTVLPSRTINARTYTKVIVMQRIHEEDPAGKAIEEKLPDGTRSYQLLCLPARFDPEEICKTLVGGDWRSQRDEMLEPVRYPRDVEDKRAAGMGGWDGPVASAQLNQKPAPPGGLIFKKESFGVFSEAQLPCHRTFLTLSIDANFKEGEVSSDCGITITGSSLEAGARLYVYHAQSENMGFIALLNLIEQLLKSYPGIAAILIEDKANGPALIEMLRQKHYNVIAVDPKTSKSARAHAANVLYQGRSVYHNSAMTDLVWFEKVLSTYPRGKKKDVVDALSQQLLYLAQGDDAARDAALAQLTRGGTAGLVGALGGFDRHFTLR